MAIDTPATILIIGAGPLGLETALYARYLGYDVIVCEAGDVGSHVQQWEHVEMFSPFSMNASPLGIAAIESHDPDHQFPSNQQCTTGGQWLQQYLIPLSQTDLVRKHIRTNCRVLSVSRTWKQKTDLDTDLDQDSREATREQDPFRIIVDEQGTQHALTADVVIDTSGVLANPNPIGAGGVPAPGEQQAGHGISYSIPSPDDLGQFRGKRVAVVGSGHSATTALLMLTEANALVTWITRQTNEHAISPIEQDPLPLRSQITSQLKELVDRKAIQTLTNIAIDEIKTSDNAEIELGVYQTGTEDELTLEWHSFDHVIGLTGYRPDLAIFRELQIHQCYATEGPIKLAASLLTQSSDDCLKVEQGERELLINPELNFYVLGMKSYGRKSGFLFQTGLQQIVQLFQILGDRETLDVYATFQKPQDG